MITAYIHDGAHIDRLVDPDLSGLDRDRVVWIDLVAPPFDEIARVERYLGVDVPTRDQFDRVDIASRLVATDAALMMGYSTIADDGDRVAQVPITCVLDDEQILTIRPAGCASFDGLDPKALVATGAIPNPRRVFFALLSANIDHLADRLEQLRNEIDRILIEVFGEQDAQPRTGREVHAMIKALGFHGSQLLKMEDSLIGLRRLVTFMKQHSDRLAKDRHDIATLNAMIEDVRILNELAEALDGKVDFLLDGMLGLIDLDQNQIMKIISILAALFLPATLISSIFGMNFTNMPELRWHDGFVFAVGLMVGSAVLMAIFFRWRRWM
ncbi:CorA family divalent cation transporter [Acuticoccus mangrovi]|uniref:Magnesium transporter n=1 Tax=Acuticoccus mangrovi TaxID=2796142 RepID=A0A934IJ37_9HYPH|nr:CorA family divalent cation transporter [Acuticoccus mangrovi]MBJ3777634.1 hypothetical protein [Acuticoccus mangrovi]